MRYVLAIDQGTTSSRAILFDSGLRPVATSPARRLHSIFPVPDGWNRMPRKSGRRRSPAASQYCPGSMDRTLPPLDSPISAKPVVVWDRDTGKPVGNAIVWQDRRTADICANLAADGQEAAISRKTGLLLDPYFSATKLAWILDHADGSRDRAKNGQLLFGTIDSYLIWKLTGGVHATDGHQRLANNAVRHQSLQLGRRVAAPVRRSAADDAADQGLRSRIRHLRSVLAGCADSCPGREPAISRQRRWGKPALTKV